MKKKFLYAICLLAVLPAFSMDDAEVVQAIANGEKPPLYTCFAPRHCWSQRPDGKREVRVVSPAFQRQP